MIIPYEQLRPDTLQSIIEDYVTRQGAVHGHQETPLPEMVHEVMTQLRAGKVVIMFDQAEETCGIFTARDAGRAIAGPPAMPANKATPGARTSSSTVESDATAPTAGEDTRAPRMSDAPPLTEPDC